jgi:lipopolysaccharide export system protein LptA
MRPLYSLLFLLLLATGSWAQTAKDTGNQVPITIDNARVFQSVQVGGKQTNKLIGEVAMTQGGTQFFCDSAYLDLTGNNVEAFGNVRIVQPGGTNVASDYLRYTGNTKLAYLKGNVSLDNGADNLLSEDLTYNVATKVGDYTQGGTLQTASTTLTSNRGTYNARTKESRFTEEVIVSDPDYTIVSDDLGYNTETKLVKFLGPSVVKNDKSELRTTDGYYDSKAERAKFRKRSSIWSGDQYVEGNEMDYDRKTGLGIAVGRVMALDTVQDITLWSNRATVNEQEKTLLAVEKPVLRKADGKDTLHMRADTFFAAPYNQILARQQAGFGKPAGKAGVGGDSTAAKGRKARRQQEGKRASAPETRTPRSSINAVDFIAATDTARRQPAGILASSTDTSRAFIGFHHVVIFSDSLQARCDSLSYTQRDSTLRLMQNPVAWSRESQITGDTLLLQNDSGKIKRLFIPANAFVASRTGPPAAAIFDQVQGKTLTGAFTDGTLKKIIVWPSAESIYYPKDDSERFLGVNQTSSERLTLLLGQKSLESIFLEQEVKQTMRPLGTVNLIDMRLSRFIWREKERPLSLKAIFE